MSLHDKIIDIPPSRTDSQGYLIGHRDARHAAAELAIEHDALLVRFTQALQEISDIQNSYSGGDWDEISQARIIARAALAAARGEVGK